jgi:hypothetical protein
MPERARTRHGNRVFGENSSKPYAMMGKYTFEIVGYGRREFAFMRTTPS